MGVTLVLLHAFPLDHRLFEELGRLPADVLTPDLPGFGGRELGRSDPDLDLFADSVIADLDAAGIERAVIGGVSMGGYVALNILARYPSRVRGLVLADTRASADPVAARENRAKMAAAADAGDAPSPMDLIHPLVSDFTRAENVAALTRLAQIAADQPASTIAWAQRAMAARPARLTELAASQIPVLVLVGECDAVTGPEFAQQMADAAAESRLVVLPDVGHLTPLEDPAGFTTELAQWLEDNFEGVS